MRTIHVGLTGLSRAGKTVFLTSVIHELTSLTGQDLREFKNSGWSYAGNSVQLGDGKEQFPYKDRLRGFREDPPRWPESTEDVTEYRVHLKLMHTEGRRREGVVVFVDYPGERLVDVALLDTSYEEWSDECHEKLVAPSKEVSVAAGEFLDCVKAMQPEAQRSVPDHQKRALEHTFGDYAVASRQSRNPVSPLVPVLTAISQGTRACAPFFPLDALTRKQMPRLHKVLKESYERYVNDSVWPFLKQIAACNHQFVLVDVLDILRSGVEKHNEVKEQFQRVLHCYRKVNAGFFKRVLSKLPFVGGPQIQKVTFCATKADQAMRGCRQNLVWLLKELFTTAAKEIHFDHKIIKMIDYKEISALRCTDDIDTDHEGTPVVGLKGRWKARLSDGERPYHPDPVPAKWPLYANDWKAFQFPDVLPRPLPAINTDRALPSIKMDQILFSIAEALI